MLWISDKLRKIQKEIFCSLATGKTGRKFYFFTALVTDQGKFIWRNAMDRNQSISQCFQHYNLFSKSCRVPLDFRYFRNSTLLKEHTFKFIAVIEDSENVRVEIIKIKLRKIYSLEWSYINQTIFFHHSVLVQYLKCSTW